MGEAYERTDLCPLIIGRTNTIGSRRRGQRRNELPVDGTLHEDARARDTRLTGTREDALDHALQSGLLICVLKDDVR